MPSMVPPEAARFEVRDGVPVLTLAVETPAEPVAGEWSLVNRLTVVMIDGPGDEGFLMPRFTDDGDVAPDGWDDAVDRAGGSHVRFGAGEDAPTVFVRNLI